MEDEQRVMKNEDKSKTAEFNINRKIFVGNISYRIKSRKLTKFFSKFGPVEYCYIVKDHIKKWSRGIAFVTFKDEESMQRALQASDDELFFDQRQMHVKPAELSKRATYWQESQYSDDDDDSEMELEKEKKLDHITVDQVTEGTPCLMDSLYDDVLLRIFSLLTWKERVGVERVCWRWKNLIQRTWISQKNIHFQNVFRSFQGLSDKMLNSLLQKCGQYLESLDLSSSPRYLTDFSVDIIGRYCPQIKELDLSTVNVTDVSLRNLFNKCTNLHKVKLSRCSNVSDKGVTTILTSGGPLSHLDISNLSIMIGKCFKNIHSDLDTLKCLKMTDCFKVDDSSFINMVSHSRNLEELCIDNCGKLTGASLKSICQNCPHLKVLHAAHAKFDFEALQDLKKLKALEELNLFSCQMVNDQALKSISEGCKRLRYLDISGCHGVTDIGVVSLAKLPQLETINLSYLNQVTGDSVIKLAQNGSLIKFIARATQFPTDDVIIKLVALCPRLNHIDISGCFQVTNKIFDAFRNIPDSEQSMNLILGGTSVDWLSDDVDWIRSGIARLTVSMHNLAIEGLRADRDIVLPSYDEEDFWDDEVDDYPPHPPLTAYQPEHVEMLADWDDDDDDEFLDNDDPLEYERWNMS